MQISIPPGSLLLTARSRHQWPLTCCDLGALQLAAAVRVVRLSLGAKTLAFLAACANLLRGRCMDATVDNPGKAWAVEWLCPFCASEVGMHNPLPDVLALERHGAALGSS